MRCAPGPTAQRVVLVLLRSQAGHYDQLLAVSWRNHDPPQGGMRQGTIVDALPDWYPSFRWPRACRAAEAAKAAYGKRLAAAAKGFGSSRPSG